MMRIGALTVSLAMMAVTFGGTAFAQQQPGFDFSVCEGALSSLALGDIPAGDAYTVDIFDPTEASLKFRQIFLATLAKSAKPIGEGANLVFTFRAESIFRGITSRRQISPTFRGDAGVSSPSQRRDEDETRDLIESDRRNRGETRSASQQILVEAELRNRSTQRVIWLATVQCEPVTNDDDLLMQFVSQAIVENIGRAVKQKRL